MKLESWVLQCMAWVLWVHKILDGEGIEVPKEWWNLLRGLTVEQGLYRLMVGAV